MTERARLTSVRTLLFSDVEGSTFLLERAGDQFAELIGRHRTIMRRAIDEHGGDEHGTEGDSFFVSFDSASAAVAAAVQMQRALCAEPWPEGCDVRVRMGVHTGEVSHHDEGPIGLAIHHAARLAAAAHGGQLIVSDDVRRLGARLPADVSLKPLGDHRLRDLGTIAIFQVMHPELPRDFGPLRAMPSSRGNLPRIAEPLIGQGDTLDALVQMVEDRALVTLTGTGGVGKTRLAVEAAALLADRYEGAWLLELAAVAEAESVVANVCNTLSIPPQPDMSPHQSMLDWMSGRRLLLVVDNCEHVVDEAARLVTSIMRSCPDVHLMATSREPLGVPGERVHRVSSLGQDRAVELFVERMRAADDTSTIVPADQEVLLEICRRLDGIPLAIQLAAARARSLSLTELLDRLADRFRLLRGGARGALDRHQTLQATVSWSYQLLTGDEQIVFDRLAVFVGGFELLAAEHVCAGDGLDRSDVLEVLHGLVDKSMVLAERTGSTTRYRLLETLRQFGEDDLDRAGTLAAARDRHLTWYTDLADTADAFVLTARHSEGNRIFDADWDNFRAAQSWALTSAQLALAADIVCSCFHYAINHVRSEHADWLDRLIAELDDGDPNTTRLLGQAAYWTSVVLGEWSRGQVLAERGIELAPSRDHADTLNCWASIIGANNVTLPGSDISESGFSGMCVAVEKLEDPDRHWESVLDVVDSCLWGHVELMDAWFQRLEVIAARVRCPSLDLYVRLIAGHGALSVGVPDAKAAMGEYLRALDIARQIGDTRGMGNALRAVAMASCFSRDPAALARSVEALDHLFHLRFWQKAYQTLEDVAFALAAAEALDDAAVVVGFLEREVPTMGGIETQLGFRPWTMEQIQSAPCRGEMIRRGAAMTRDEVALFVLHESAARLAM